MMVDIFFARYTCLNYQKFVLKTEFATGQASQLLDNLVYSCLVSGWFNDSSGAYTCTKNCSLPTEMAFFKHNWITIQRPGVIPYGTLFK
jgi:hypothetical protein